ncbi:MAG TPA: M48 family metallopeptidase [Actinomycetota bacterium]|jgi:predicted metal-dependent hydrolase|nr:M48 family metallopeptidase [Actinomycetota bacterium]
MKVEVVRSPRRRKTIQAERRGRKVVVLLPVDLTRSEERRWVRTMVERLTQRERLDRLNASPELERRARDLNERYFGGRLRWRSIRYVKEARGQYGSCTPEDRTIRVSERVAEFPSWVRTYVVMHELAHLRIPEHSPHFWKVVRRYPMAERARGYLIAKGLDA